MSKPVNKPKLELQGVRGKGKYNLHIGQIWPTSNFGDIEVLHIGENFSTGIEVRFLNTNNLANIKLSSLVRGSVKDKLFGVGYNSKRGHKTKTTLEKKCYDYWKTMITRSYSPSYQKEHPTYSEVFVCPAWLDYQNFADWYITQKYTKPSYQLDKDLIFCGNLEYSPDKCCMIPQEVNKALTVKQGVKGYNYHKRDNVLETSYRGTYLGRSTDYTKEILQDKYINARVAYVRSLGAKYQNELPTNIVNALLGYDCKVVNGYIHRFK